MTQYTASLRSLRNLATVVAHRITRSTTYPLVMITKPATIQQQAFEVLEVSPNLGYL